MTQHENRGFLDELSEMRSDDQVIFLATALGTVVRAAAADTRKARDTVDETIKIIERSAGLRL